MCFGRAEQLCGTRLWNSFLTYARSQFQENITMKNFYRVPRAQLADDAIAVADAIANGKISGLSQEQSASLAEAITTYINNLQTSNRDAVEAKKLLNECTSIADKDTDLLARQLSTIKFMMHGLGASPDEYAALGFVAPAETAVR